MTKIAILSFPGNNCEVESLRAIERCGMEAVFFRWNDSREKLADVDGYFIPGGFSYEDRGRAGMVAGRDALLSFIAEEAEGGKTVIGNCNGAQVLVESGLIPMDKGLTMSLARNVIEGDAAGFLNEWVWITPTCGRDRCATSDWEGVMQLPIAHGEGRFTTKDPMVMQELQENNQIAFSYCDAKGTVSDKAPVCPNGSLFGAAGICNRDGNVIALMPHPERTTNGDPYFLSLKKWIEQKKVRDGPQEASGAAAMFTVCDRPAQPMEIFIDTIIVNNEERTVEQAARRMLPALTLKQLKYLAPAAANPIDILSTLALFNPNKEIAYIRRGASVTRWENDQKREIPLEQSPLDRGVALLRRDEPDTGAAVLGTGGQTGVCYVCENVAEGDLFRRDVLEIFANPHASTLERLV